MALLSARALFPSQGSFLAFSLIYVSYVFFYLCKKNYAFWLLALVQQVPGFSRESASMFGTVMESVYGVGKLLGGPFVDAQPSPGKVLWMALLLSAGCNALMFCPLTPPWMTPYADWAVWGVNALAQAVAWPALAQVFLNWFKDSPYRGTLYAMLSTNQSVGASLPALTLAPLMAAWGWKASLYFPAIAGAIAALVLAALLQDGPSQKKMTKTKESKGDTHDRKSRKSPWFILNSWKSHCLGAGYMFLTAIRVGVADWILVLLQDVHGLDTQRARVCIIALEAGAFLGGLATGYVSDKIFHGNRAPCLVILALATGPLALFTVMTPSSPILFSGNREDAVFHAAFFSFGLFSFGPHMLIGLLAREIFPEAPSSAGSFVKGMGQLGGALAGYPLSYIVSNYGWNVVAYTWCGCGLAASLCFVPLLRLGSNAGIGRGKMKAS